MVALIHLDAIRCFQSAERALEALVKTESPKATAQEPVEKFEEFLAGLESDAVLPEEAFERENWYPDRP
jgi:hypothetical protein